MRASLNVQFSQNTVLEQKILNECPEHAGVFAYGNTVLMFAARDNNIDLLRMCLKSGANPNVRKTLGNKEAKELAFPTPGSGLEKALVSRKNTSQLPYQHTLYYRSKWYFVRCTGLKQYGLFLEDEHGQTLYIRWNDIGKDDYVEVENSIIQIWVSDLARHLQISSFRVGFKFRQYRDSLRPHNYPENRLGAYRENSYI